MSTRFDNQRFAVGKLIGKSETVSAIHAETIARIREDQLTLGYGPNLMTAFMVSACEEAVGVGSNDSDTLDSDTLRDKLPPKVGEHKAIAWAVRAHLGESVAEVTQGTHSTIEAVQQAVDAATHHVFDESEVTITG